YLSQGFQNSLHPVAHIEAGVDLADNVFVGRLRKVELLGDLFVGEALGDERKHLALAWGQRLRRDVVGFRKRPCEISGYQAFAGEQKADGVDQVVGVNVLEKISAGSSFEALLHQAVIVKSGED